MLILVATADDSVGYFVQPTVILTKDPKSVTMVEEIFGPVLTVSYHHTLRWLKLTYSDRSMSMTMPTMTRRSS